MTFNKEEIRELNENFNEMIKLIKSTGTRSSSGLTAEELGIKFLDLYEREFEAQKELAQKIAEINLEIDRAYLLKRVMKLKTTMESDAASIEEMISELKVEI